MYILTISQTLQYGISEAEQIRHTFASYTKSIPTAVTVNRKNERNYTSAFEEAKHREAEN